jgi:hypothetical protein
VDSIIFDSTGRPVSNDSLSLNRIVSAQNPAERSAGNGVRVNTSDFARVNVGGANGAQVLEGPSVQRFNMADATNGQSGTLSEVRRDGVRVSPDDIRPTDLVKLPDGTETTALVAKRLGFLNVNPTTGAYENPSEAQQSRVDGTAAREAAKAEYEASQQRQREEVELNKHPVDEVESAHASFATQVPQQDAIAILVAANRGQAPSTSQLNKVAEAMGVDVGTAIDRLQTMNLGVQAQFTSLARARGIENPDAAADWLRQHRGQEVLSAVRNHVLGRNLRAWEPLLKAYQQSGGK